MKTDQQQQAQHLYIQTDLNKSEIAKELGVNRRTLHNWIRQNNWDRLKKSGESIPSFLAGDCYQVFGNITNHLLSEERKDKPATPLEVNSMYKLILGINKLKGHPTLNENLETFGMFSEYLNSKSPDLAKNMQPIIDGFLATQAAPNHKQYKPTKLNDEGYIPTEDATTMEAEAKLDEEDILAWSQQEKESNMPSPAPSAANPTTPASSKSPTEQERSSLNGVAASLSTSGVPTGQERSSRGEASRATPPAPLDCPQEQQRNPKGEPTPCAASAPFIISPTERSSLIGIATSLSTCGVPTGQERSSRGEASRAMQDPKNINTDNGPQPKQDIRKLFRGTATKGPGKVLRQNKPIAA
jgi:hypothetical protein